MIKKRAFFVIGLVAIAGTITAMAPRAKALDQDENWLVAHTPSAIEGYKFFEGPSTPGQSYRMDQTTYDKLHPMGISSRVFQGKQDKIDTVVIAGPSPDNFHDPTWCLPGQGWKIGKRKQAVIHSDKVGDIKLSYFEATQNGQSMIVAYTFHSPSGYTNSITRLTLDMWKSQFLTGRQPLGAFYRFLTLDGEPSIDRLENFIVKFVG